MTPIRSSSRFMPPHKVVEHQRMIEALCAWFDREARDLPWRRKRSGYAALVSESMLQQTQVSRVIDCYARFMRKFPTVKSLARADEQDVLALWQGMGYYRRARNLHAAARMIVREFAGRVPSSVDELMRLPGVGRYTAGAIASIVFHRPEPIVDGNVERVLMRLHARRDAKSQATAVTKAHAWTWKAADDLVKVASRPDVFNEAMMELGATICMPPTTKPKCETCPIANWCQARRMGLQDEIPAAKRRAKPRVSHHHAVIITRRRSGLMLVEKRGDRGMWAGMWQTPTIESDALLDEADVRNRLPVRVVEPLRTRGEFTHNTTHRRIHFHVFAAESHSRRGDWRRREDVTLLPMSNAQLRVLQFLQRGDSHNIIAANDGHSTGQRRR